MNPLQIPNQPPAPVQAQRPALELNIPLRLKKTPGCKQVLLPASPLSPPPAPGALAINLSRAHRWRQLLEEGRFKTVAELATHLQLDKSWVAKLLRLTLLAPDITLAILEGREPDGCNQELLRKPFPLDWVAQRRVLGFRAKNP